ncbi:hypothetical protein A3C67_01855 [Candidatus Nomurabacteria bacterium RIFCSPHIGHO2_02_FULL_42_19]|uniref:Uncharacterized protein n=1 Tax=Candidatus Nomurabacteria bacterium RIFCSPHIGHO2_02_FULL_42_19 TaxID=1801756 RepID=A0A1F6W2D2_9BACT|nr:MAG: hypothetical protein A3C67_01855 [Candidatus Nomurabacteria bacterium RIFCSPHIGHO2_02_FULL_42_19]
MDDTIDTLKIKIDAARRNLSEETKVAIEAVPWKIAILGMRESKGYSFEQLGDLETETELLLCGLLNPEDYPKELENRMRIPGPRVDELVNEMNQLVFSKMREELIKNTERKKIFETKTAPSVSKIEQEMSSPVTGINKDEIKVLDNAGIKIISAGEPDLTALELNSGTTPAILTQKFTGSFQIPTVKTEHVDSNNLNKVAAPKAPASYPPKGDPYRLPPEE